MSAADLAVHKRPTMSTQGIDCHGLQSSPTPQGQVDSVFLSVNHENREVKLPTMSSTISDEMDRVGQGLRPETEKVIHEK